MRRNTRGFTLIELLTVMAIISLLVGLLLPALAQARRKAQLAKDQAQVKQIHQSWITFAREFEGIFPTPGLINRLEDPVLGQQPGRGPEDVARNNSANMYSACIMQNYFAPQLAVGPTETSGFVLVKDDFNWDLYDPIGDLYWDPGFAVDLDSLCHTSYAHMPICGPRKIEQWRDSIDSKFAAISNRGVENGSTSQGLYYDSVTLEFHGGRKQWVGNVCYNDNHLSVENTFYPEGISYFDPQETESVSLPDNLFQNETGSSSTGDGFDIWLTLTKNITASCQLGVEWD